MHLHRPLNTLQFYIYTTTYRSYQAYYKKLINLIYYFSRKDEIQEN